MSRWRVVYCDQPHPIAPELAALSDEIEAVRLNPDASRAEISGLLATAHVFHNPTPPWRVTPDLLENCPDLLFCSPDGAGFDAIDVPACTARGICVANQGGLNAPTVAEFAVSVMLAHAHRLLPADRAMRGGRDWTRLAFTGRDLRGGTVGIVGFGQIGSRVGEICRTGFGMEVLAYDPFLPADRVRALGAEPAALPDLLARADVVTVHIPLSPDTRGLIGAAEFGRMKRGALFITSARGGVVDEAALAEALGSGQVGGAGVDVWDVEPPPLDHPLLRFPNVIATPHIAGSTEQGYAAVARGAAEQIVAALRGDRPPRLLNPDVWPRFTDRIRSVRAAA